MGPHIGSLVNFFCDFSCVGLNNLVPRTIFCLLDTKTKTIPKQEKTQKKRITVEMKTKTKALLNGSNAKLSGEKVFFGLTKRSTFYGQMQAESSLPKRKMFECQMPNALHYGMNGQQVKWVYRYATQDTVILLFVFIV